MLKKRKAIIHIDRTTATGYFVELGNKQVSKSVLVLDWIPQTLGEVLSKIRDKLRVNHCRILVSDELCYQLEVEVEPDVKDERQFVYEEITKIIPEQLEDEDWDYRIKKTTDSKKIAQVIALVKDFWHDLSRSVTANNIIVEAIESEQGARLRHPNPAIGLALKQDIKGKDSQVLNLTPKTMIDPYQGKIITLVFGLPMKEAIQSILLGLVVGAFGVWLALYFQIISK